MTDGFQGDTIEKSTLKKRAQNDTELETPQFAHFCLDVGDDKVQYEIIIKSLWRRYDIALDASCRAISESKRIRKNAQFDFNVASGSTQ